MLENKHHLHEKTDSFLEYCSETKKSVLPKQLPSCIKIYHQYLTDNVLCLLCLSSCFFQAKTVAFMPRKKYHVSKGFIYTHPYPSFLSPISFVRVRVFVLYAADTHTIVQNWYFSLFSILFRIRKSSVSADTLWNDWFCKSIRLYFWTF